VYLYWKNTTLGSINFSKEGVSAFINAMLLPSYTCKEVALSRSESSLYIVLSMPHPHNVLEVKMLEDKLSDALSAMGLGVHISWTEEKKEAVRKELPVQLQKPWFWAACAAGVTALVHLRIRGILWTAAVGILTYLVAQYALSNNGQKAIRGFIQYIREIIRR
jgi:hypothetical protein